MGRGMRFAHLNNSFKIRIDILSLVLSFFVAFNVALIEMFRLLRMKLVTKYLDRALYSLIQVKTIRFGIKRTQKIIQLVGCSHFIISFVY